MVTEHTDAADVNRNKEVVLRFMRLMDGHDFDALDEVLAPDLQFQIGAAHLDRQQIQDLIRVFYAAFPDLTHTPEDVLSVGDRVILRTMNRATHRPSRPRSRRRVPRWPQPSSVRRLSGSRLCTSGGRPRGCSRSVGQAIRGQGFKVSIGRYQQVTETEGRCFDAEELDV